MSGRRTGLALAAGAAAISGVAVFLNGYGVRAASDATVYTTAKNLVAAVVLALVAVWLAPGRARLVLPARRAHRAALVLLGAAGGSLPFVLFFEGLARTSPTQAALLQKTLVVWVALLAVPLLTERLGALQLGAVGLLVLGQAALSGRPAVSHWGSGETLVLAATLLWAAETVFARRLLRHVAPATLGVARMGLGTVVLVAWLAVSGRLGLLAALSPTAWRWAAVTGVVLAAYVSLWLRALALAPAADVTALLVPGAILTGVLDIAVKGAPFTGATATGMTLLVAGGLLVLVAARHAARRPARQASP